jgi:hypothetical protein
METTASPHAQLRIHATADPRVRASYLASTLQWLRGKQAGAVLRADVPKAAPGTVLQLHIDDLQGQRLFSDSAAKALVALDLPVGTHQVTAQYGDVCRGYTLTLAAGDGFDLYLCPSLGSGCTGNT